MELGRCKWLVLKRGHCWDTSLKLNASAIFKLGGLLQEQNIYN